MRKIKIIKNCEQYTAGRVVDVDDELGYKLCHARIAIPVKFIEKQKEVVTISPADKKRASRRRSSVSTTKSKK